jgi:superfamily I DNA/RNA helicase
MGPAAAGGPLRRIVRTSWTARLSSYLTTGMLGQMDPEKDELQAELDEMERGRAAASDAIVESNAYARLIVAGPGTGKTYTFRRALERAVGRGLALTFIRNLVGDLAEALGDIADVFTFHGFCKNQMHQNPGSGPDDGWSYYPPLADLLVEDVGLLRGIDVGTFGIERRLHGLDEADGIVGEARRVGDYYNAVAHTDLVYRMLRFFEQNEDAVPEYPLIVVDEYQDFSRLETEFIRILSAGSPMLVAGDDDQALYAFKNASPEFIRELASGHDYERFELPYCSRCTAVVVDSVNDVIRRAEENGNLVGRLDKEFECYLPDKLEVSEAHPRIIHAQCSVERNNAPYIGRYVTLQIAAIPEEEVRESRENGHPTVLVVGPNPFLQKAYDAIREVFPNAELKKSVATPIDPLDGYRRLGRDEQSRLGWRIIINCFPFDGWEEVVREALTDETEVADLVPAEYKAEHLRIAQLIRRLWDGEEVSELEQGELAIILGRDAQQLRLELGHEPDADEGEEGEDEDDLAHDATEPSIVCTSLVGAKGLSAAYVFVVGFNNGHFPRNPDAVSDGDVCSFLVALSRTRTECQLVSCRRLGQEELAPSRFLQWIDRSDREHRTVNAAFFA